MSEQIRESLSALMDGEADELELRRLLAEDNADLVRSTWSRYHLLRDSMKGNADRQRFAHLEISHRVSEAIAYHEQPNTNPLSKDEGKVEIKASWLKTVSSFAVAASVTVAVVIAVQEIKPSSGEFNSLAASNISNSIETGISEFAAKSSSRVYAPSNAVNMVNFPQASGNGIGGKLSNTRANSFPAATATSQLIADLEAQKRLEKYILRHTERAALNNGQGMISFSRISSFESK